jgi:ABC-type antimicrobial peptide transport system permease subunit
MHMFLRRAFFTILVPILIGIFAGTLTYLIGMALGCLIAITVARVRGQTYQPIALEEDVEDAAADERSEKHEYAELPAYEAPPVYADAPEKKATGETK